VPPAGFEPVVNQGRLLAAISIYPLDLHRMHLGNVAKWGHLGPVLGLVGMHGRCTQEEQAT